MKSKFYYLATVLFLTLFSGVNAQDWQIRGTVIDGYDAWGDGPSLTDEGDGTFSYTGDFKAGEFKVTDGSSWLGGPIELGDNWQATGGDNIVVSEGNYTLMFNPTASEIKLIANSVTETNWTDVPVELVGGAVSVDNSNAEPDANSGWNWGNVLAANNSGMPIVSGSQYTWSWDATILEIEGFKIRIKDATMPVNGNGSVFDIGFSGVDASVSSANIEDNGGNIYNTVKGAYNITLTIDAADTDKKTIVITNHSSALGFAKISNTEFNIYPSPIVSSATIEYTLTDKSNVNISVFNVVGKLMKSQYLQNQNIGIHKVKFEAFANYPKGIYFVKLSANNNVSVKKIIVK
ncbi:MAG: T9SS type A sorting domain-containing protein [Flavobacteriales bacterium]|nr:T9SS type A sorting domain-containing protein [Flavobacteriales bacterium]